MWCVEDSFRQLKLQVVSNPVIWFWMVYVCVCLIHNCDVVWVIDGVVCVDIQMSVLDG